MNINIIDIDTSNKEDRLNFSCTSEHNLLQELKLINVNINTVKDPFCPIDFILNLENTIVFMELKTRKFHINTYDTTIIGINKVNYVDNLPSNKTKKLICIFGFLDNDMQLEYYYIMFNRPLFKSFTTKLILQLEYYYIMFNRPLFKSFTTKLIFNTRHLEIPVNLLLLLNQLGVVIKSL